MLLKENVSVACRQLYVDFCCPVTMMAGYKEVKLAALSCSAAWAVNQLMLFPLFTHLLCFWAQREGKTENGSSSFSAINVILIAASSQTSRNWCCCISSEIGRCFALLCVMKIAAADVNADEILSKKKIWQLILQSEPPTIIPDSLSEPTIIPDSLVIGESFYQCIPKVYVGFAVPSKSGHKKSSQWQFQEDSSCLSSII
ncbi:hypothetical protein PHJA_002693000 [Phtheirospermum japonicum]|uniref:Uncharacterized protein n=1 Tax=Phtheirospermum japonicum TaxID=374723 RepID=A0A830D6L6_9LAMI|nr:hypothetical protein PHJA_002693000 [Phtheirospermum japonicum]